MLEKLKNLPTWQKVFLMAAAVLVLGLMLHFGVPDPFPGNE